MTATDTPYLTGQLLLAMPQMGDPRFHRAVIYLCVHDEKGAMGLVINHVLPGLEFGDLLTQLNIVSDITVPPSLLHRPVMSGGPVETARGFLLHSPEFRQEGTIRIDSRVSVTGTLAGLRAVAGGKGPEHMLFTLGYAGWGAEQLEREILDNAWLTLPAAPELMFQTSPQDMWSAAIHKLGIDPALLSGAAGQA